MITATALLLSTFIYLVLTRDRAWSNITLPERNDLVFEGRHRGYGAYQLRKEYDHRLVVAFLLTIGLLVLLAALPRVVSWLTPPVVAAPPVPSGTTVILTPTPYFPDNPPPRKATATVASNTPKEVTLFVVPIDSVLTPPPDTANTSYLAALTPPLPMGNDGAGGLGSDSARVDALSGGPGPGAGPWKPFQVDEPPEFPGGKSALAPWVRDHLRFPQGIVGKDEVYVQFTVGVDGTVLDARAISGTQALCKDAAERTVSSMPRWKPARMNGHDVPCRLTLPIRFEVR